MKNDSRKKYVMSVELAIQKEMAYRKKLESSQVKQGNKTRKASSVQQNEISVPASSCGPRLTAEAPTTPTSSSWFKPSLQLSSPSPIQTQGPCLLPTHIMPSQGRRAGPRLSARPGFPSGSCQAGPRPEYILGQRARPAIVLPNPHLNLTQGLSITPRPMSLFGPYCQPNLLIRPSFTANPFPGPRLELNLSPGQKRKEAPHQQLQPDNGFNMSKLCCGVCKVTCTSASNLEMHLRGQKHQAKAKKLQEMKTGKKESPIEVNDPRLCCELCGIWCMNEFSYQQHLSGKNHILKLHAQNK